MSYHLAHSRVMFINTFCVKSLCDILYGKMNTQTGWLLKRKLKHNIQIMI